MRPRGPSRIGKLLRDIDGYTGKDLTRAALKLSPICFPRPENLRKVRWRAIDLENAQWRMEHRHIKKKVQHIIPLSRQAVQIFRELVALTGDGEFVFPCLGDPDRPMSENTVNEALCTLGYAHNEDDEVRGAYNHAEHLRLRRTMMQVYADYLDELRAGRVQLPDKYFESVYQNHRRETTSRARPAQRVPLTETV